MSKLLVALIAFLCCVLPIVIIGVLGKYWGKKWIRQGVMTESEMYNIGYIGCFFAKIFGF